MLATKSKVCPYCGKERNSRGFHLHIRACKERNDPLRKRYALQIANMSPEQAERFLRKAKGI